MMRALALTICFVAAVLVSAAQPREEAIPDLLIGPWDVAVQAPDGPYPSWFELSRQGTQVTGQFVGRVGSARPVPGISFAGGALTLRIPVQYEQNKSDLVFTGRLFGDRLEGTTADATGKTLKWAAVKAPPLDRPMPPQWGKPIALFNGKDLSGWRLRQNDRGRCWSVVDGALTNTPPCVDIVSDQRFDDFQLDVEFNIVPKSNSGVYLRGRYEVQINDDFGGEPANTGMGSVYGFVTPKVNASARAGEWQRLTATFVGRRLTAVLNGRTIIDNVRIPGITGGALDSDEGLPGPLMLQGDHGKIAFRQIAVSLAQ